MDMREIQRLHEQFAPDSMVIDLPRQIAALPSPGVFSADPAPTARLRWMKAGPLVRGTVICVAVAALLAMAGMGAASVYRNLHVGRHVTPVAAPIRNSPDSGAAVATDKQTPLFRDIDAAPAQPIRSAPPPSASDIGAASPPGFTADQFRNSMKIPARAGAAPVSPALTTEAQRAATSPIHRAEAKREQRAIAPQPTPAPPVPGIANNTAANVPAQATTAQKVAPVAALTVPPAAVAASVAAPAPAPAAPAEAGKIAHPVRRHIARPHDEQPGEPATPSKPAAASHPGSAEVQMF